MTSTNTDTWSRQLPPCFKIFLWLFFDGCIKRLEAPSFRLPDLLKQCAKYRKTPKSKINVEEERDSSEHIYEQIEESWKHFNEKFHENFIKVVEQNNEEFSSQEREEGSPPDELVIFKNAGNNYVNLVDDDNRETFSNFSNTFLKYFRSSYPLHFPEYITNWKTQFMSTKEWCSVALKETDEDGVSLALKEKEMLMFSHTPASKWSAGLAKASTEYGKRVAALVRFYESLGCDVEEFRKVEAPRQKKLAKLPVTSKKEGQQPNVFSNLEEEPIVAKENQRELEGPSAEECSDEGYQKSVYEEYGKETTINIPTQCLDWSKEGHKEQPIHVDNDNNESLDVVKEECTKISRKEERQETRTMRPAPFVKNRLIRYPRSESILSGPLCLVPSRWYRSLNYRPLSKTESGIGSVVYELVKSRFKEAWRKFDQQKLKGKRFRPRLVSEGYFEEDELEKENLYEEVDFVIFHSQRESSDSGLSQTNSALSRNAIETSDEDPYYCSPARSKSFPSYGPEFSVGSSNISALMSCSERFSQCSRRGLGRRHLFNSTSTCDSSTYVSVPEYDSAPNLALAKKKFVVDEGIDFQRHVIHQISRALSICRSHPKLVDPSVHAEAEKIMLVAACKKQLLELLESMKDSTESPAATSEMDLSVTLRNLKFVREGRWKSRKSKKRSWFFICVLETDNEVMASEMVKAEGKNIHFPNSFHFKGHSQGECIVKLQLYALALKNRKKKNKENSVLKFGPSSLANAPEHTFFFLWGQADLKPSYKTKTTFQLLNIRPGASISSTFEADLETSLIIPIKKKGYLSVLENQTDQFIWKRKWCVLNGSILSYWNYKYEEGTVEPLKHVDLHFVRRLQVEPDREGTIVQPKCFALHFEGNDQFFACTDTIEELEKWRGKLNSVLEHIWRWKSRDEP